MAADRRDADGALLDALAVALQPSAAEPSRAELAALQRVVTGTAAPVLAARRVELRRRLAAAAAVVVVGSGGTAFATSQRAPREVRVVAHAIKLPVEAPDVTDARHALDALEAALDAEPVRLDHVREAVAGVERELAELAAGDRAGLSLRATTLLERARALLAPPPPPAPDDDRAGTSDDRAIDDGVGARELDDSSGSDSSGSGGSGSSGSDDDADDRSGTSSGSDSSGSGSVETDDLDGTSGREGSTSGSSGSTGSEPGSDDSSDHTGSGSGDDD